MNIDTNALVPADLSDEVAYHLINFFYDFAVAFEAIHLEQIMRHEKAIVDKEQDRELCEGNKELPDPPF